MFFALLPATSSCSQILSAPSAYPKLLRNIAECRAKVQGNELCEWSLHPGCVNVCIIWIWSAGFVVYAFMLFSVSFHTQRATHRQILQQDARDVPHNDEFPEILISSEPFQSSHLSTYYLPTLSLLYLHGTWAWPFSGRISPPGILIILICFERMSGDKPATGFLQLQMGSVSLQEIKLAAKRIPNS